MLIIDNFVHADLHPGNILITFKTHTPQGQALFSSLGSITTHQEWTDTLDSLELLGATPQLVFLDAGLVSSLSHQNLINFLDLFDAITQFDGARIAQLMMDRSTNPESVVYPERFRLQMTEFLDSVKASTASLEHIHVGQILGKVLNMVRDHHVKIEGDFVNVAIAIMLIEGIGHCLDSNVDVIQQSVPVLKMVKERGDPFAHLANQVYRKAQVYSFVMNVRDRWNSLFSQA